jgi:uncharacterized protein YbaP (TraB family)
MEFAHGKRGGAYSPHWTIWFGIWCFLAGVSVVTAADKVAPSPPSIRLTKAPVSCVWRIVNAKAPFYLVGSVHALTQKDYPLPAAFETALNESKRLVFEYDPNLNDDFQKKLAAAGKYPPGQDIRNRIHPQTLAYLRGNTRYVDLEYDEKRKEYRETLKGFDDALQYRPWWIYNHLFDIRSFDDVSDRNGVDAWFEDHGRQMGKELGGIETIDEHVAVLGGLSDRDGEILLLDALASGDRVQAETYSTRTAWRRGDVEKMWMLDGRLRKEAPWIAARLLDARNVKWVPRIVAEIKSGKPTAIIVGAFHFGGPNGLLALLRKRGYVIEQL